MTSIQSRAIRKLRVALLVPLLITASCADTILSEKLGALPETRPPLNRRSLTPDELAEFERQVDRSSSIALSPESPTSGQTISTQAVTCNLGSYACGDAEVQRWQYYFTAWGTTQAVNGHTGYALSVTGQGYFRRSFEFPQGYLIGDQCTGVAVCSDTEQFTHSCATEYNYMSLYTQHVAVVEGEVFIGMLSDSDECDDNPQGGPGSPSGGQDCETEWVIIEVRNPETGLWEYHSTLPVEVCS